MVEGIAIFWLILVYPKDKNLEIIDFRVLIVVDFYLAEEEGLRDVIPRRGSVKQRIAKFAVAHFLFRHAPSRNFVSFGRMPK